MLSASHIDRLRKRPNYQRFLSLEAIQKRICNGKDLYDMLPEVYSWGDLINFWGGARHEGGGTSLPQAVVLNWQRFSFLLPGGCIREPGDF